MSTHTLSVIERLPRINQTSDEDMVCVFKTIVLVLAVAGKVTVTPL
jgi:hypothetical protein